MKAQFIYEIILVETNRLKSGLLVFDIDFFQTFCPQCGIVYRQQDSLEQNMKTIHEGLF